MENAMNFPHYKVWRTPVTKGALPKPLPVCVCASKATAKLIAGVLDRLFLDKFTYTFENSECPSHLDPCLKLYASPDNCTILSRYAWVRFIAVNEYKQGEKTCSPKAWEMANNRFDQYVREGVLKPLEN